jgi:hypothetical protein
MPYFVTFTDHGLDLELTTPPAVVNKISDCLEPVKAKVMTKLQSQQFVLVHLYRPLGRSNTTFVKERTIIFDKDFVQIWQGLHQKFNN